MPTHRGPLFMAVITRCPGQLGMDELNVGELLKGRASEHCAEVMQEEEK